MEEQYIMIKAYLITILLGTSILVNAQEIEQPVEIMLKSGVILNGFMDDEEKLIDGKQINFTSGDESNTQWIAIDSIQEITVGEEGIARKYFGFSTKQIADSNPEYILLQALILGTVNLYKHKERFYISGDEEIEELLNTFDSINNASSRRKQFRVQLEQVFTDCEEAEEAIKTVQFKEESLQALFTLYNTCNDQKRLSYTINPIRKSTSFYLLAGGAFTRVSRNEDQIINIGTGVLQARVGVGMSWEIGEDSGRALLFEGIYSPFATLDDQAEIDVKLDYLQFNVAYQSSWQSKNSSPYLLAGIRYARLINERRLMGLPALVMEENMIGMLLGFGFEKRKLRFGLRYEVDNFGLFFAQAPNYYANTLSVIFAYRL
jgi:hypothetical protein